MMTTNVEKLVRNIFERTNGIIEQVKQQTYLYEQQLASNLLIQGINPPPWFLNPNLHSVSSDPQELNREELISDLLLPHARLTFPYSTGQCYLRSRVTGIRDNGELLDKLPNDIQIQDSNNVPDTGDEPRLVHESHGNDVGYSANCVPRLSSTYSHDQADVGITNISIKSGQSPGISRTSQLVIAQDGEKASDESHMIVGAFDNGLDGGNELLSSVPKCSSTDQTEFSIPNTDIAPDQSLARLQRSKSRQKALELRTSGKATKSRLSDENKRISFGAVTGVALCGIDSDEADHYKGLLKMDKSPYTSRGSSGKRVASGALCNENGTNNNCGRMTRSRSTCQRPSSVNEPSKLAVSYETVRKHRGEEKSVISQSKGIDLSMENGTSGQIKRSTTSCIQDICPNESLEICRTSTIEYEGVGSLSQLMDYDHQPLNEEIEVAVPFHASKEKSDEREEAAIEISKVREKESSKSLGNIMRSMSSSQQHSHVNDAVGLGTSCYIPEVDGGILGESSGKLSQNPDKPNEVLEVVKPSEVDCTNKSSKDTCHSNKLVPSATSFDIADLKVTHSRSDATENIPLLSSLNRSDENTHKDLSGSQLVLPVTKSSGIVNQEEKVPFATAIEHEGHLPGVGSNLDDFNIRTESEGLDVRLAADANFVVKPKQLDFNDLEDCRLNECDSLPSVIKSPQQYLQRTCHKLPEPESLEKSTNDYPSKVSFEMQLLPQSEACEEKTNAPEVDKTNTEECNEIETTLEAYIIGKHQVNHAEDGSDLHKRSYQDMHPPNCLLKEGCAEQRIDEGNFCCVRGTASEIIPIASQQQCSVPSAVPKLTPLVTEDPNSFLDEEVNMKDQPDGRCCIVDDEKKLQQNKHSFDCENINTLSSTEIMCLEDGSNNLAEGGLYTSASFGDHQNEYNNICSLEFGEAQPTLMSSLPKSRYRHIEFNSWPQLKRRKIDYQQTNCSSAIASLREQNLHSMQGGHRMSSHSKNAENDLDAVQKLLAFSSSCEQDGSESSGMFFEKMECHLADGTFCSPVFKNQQEDGQFCFTEQMKVVQTTCPSENEELGPCLVSSLSKQATRESQGSFVENFTTSYPPNEILAAKSLSPEQEFQKIFHVRNDGDLEDADILTSSRNPLLDCDPHLKDGGPVGLQCNNELAFDQNLPIYEGFVVDEHSDNVGLDASRDEINFTGNSMQRASILEQICRNVSMCTPLVHLSPTYKPFTNEDPCLSVPTRLHEHADRTSNISLSEDAGNHLQATSTNEVDSALRKMLYSDSLPYSGAQYSWNAKNCDTPVGRFCPRITSSLVNSEKRLSSNPELTCFRIEEDSCVLDETENVYDDDHIQEDISLAETNSCSSGEPPPETIEVFLNPPAAKKLHQTGGLDHSNAEIQSSVKQRLRSHSSNNKSKLWGKENLLSAAGAYNVKVSESLHNRLSKAKLSSTTSIRRGTQRLSEKVKRNNIVSNVTSFIPLVKQKQEAAVCKGKRDIKVRALEAAEAAKRQEEKKENERKIKKEALKLERAKIEQETLRQRELDKRKKEEELKKKEADLAARKRLREEEGRMEKERKRKRIVGWQGHRVQEEKTLAKIGEKEKRCANTGKSTNIRKESNSRTGKAQQLDKVSRDENTLKKPKSQTEFKGTKSSIQEVNIAPENCESLGTHDGSRKSTSMLDRLSSRSGDGHEKSYEMSPYQHSDDEEEEEDEMPTKKFIPTWASKNSVALVLSSQQQIDPSVIFPRESFCSMNEVLLPRHLQ
ncbi:uncharacterized protein LOC108219190 isoform X1 [Daucus carota subsp. sativus]|uniref:uncharacterized protein LOC108219190 isoform X1 n=1 Tax=Daucus carota subsp. sativus TaxID=79200 RepID=UPI0007F0171D|nr:PREDICTED: uncharacterized protein LOC108219190 isoform X1 [Daucus carota subsp. sativus]